MSIRRQKSLYLDPDVIAILEEKGHVTGVSMSQVANDAIRLFNRGDDIRGVVRQELTAMLREDVQALVDKQNEQIAKIIKDELGVKQ